MFERRLPERQGEDVTSGAIIDVMRTYWWVSKKRKDHSDANEASLADVNYFAKNKSFSTVVRKGI